MEIDKWHNIYYNLIMADHGNDNPAFDFGSFVPTIESTWLSMQNEQTGVHDLAHAVAPALHVLQGPSSAVIKFAQMAIDSRGLAVMERELEYLTTVDDNLGDDEKRAAIFSGKIVTLALASCPRLEPALRDMDPGITPDAAAMGYAIAGSHQTRTGRWTELRDAYDPIKRFVGTLNVELNKLYPNNRNSLLARASMVGGYARLFSVAEYSGLALDREDTIVSPVYYETLDKAYRAMDYVSLGDHADEAMELAEQLPAVGGLAGFVIKNLRDDYVAPLALSGSLARTLKGQARTIEDYNSAVDMVAGCDTVLLAHMLSAESKSAVLAMERDGLAKYLPEALAIATDPDKCDDFKRKLRSYIATEQLWELYLELGESTRTRVLAKDPLLRIIKPDERLPADLPEKYRLRIAGIRFGNHIALITIFKHLQEMRGQA